MSSQHELSPADVGDRHRRLLAFALIALGLQNVAMAAEKLAESPGPLVEPIQVTLSLCVIGFLLPTLIWKARNRHVDLHLYRGNHGFVADVVARAQMASWLVTVVVLSLISVLDDTLDSLAGMPIDVPLHITLAVMLIVFSGVFLYLSRDTDEGEEPVDA